MKEYLEPILNTEENIRKLYGAGYHWGTQGISLTATLHASASTFATYRYLRIQEHGFVFTSGPINIKLKARYILRGLCS